MNEDLSEKIEGQSILLAYRHRYTSERVKCHTISFFVFRHFDKA